MEALSQRYSTIEDARNAIQQNKFMTQAIVQESDGTYSIQEFNSDVEEKVSNVLKKEKTNNDKYTLKDELKSVGVASTVVELFSSDYDSNFNVGISFENQIQIDTNDLIVKGNKYQKELNKTYVKEDLSTNQLKTEMLSLTSEISDLKSFNETLSKISSNGNVKISDLKTLSSVYKNIMKKIDSGEVNVSDEMKSKLKNLSSLVENVESNYKEHFANLEQMNSEIINMVQVTSTSLPKLEKLSKQMGNNAISSQVTKLMSDYEKVLKEGDREKIALYTAYIQRIDEILSYSFKGMSESGKSTYLIRELGNAENKFNYASGLLNNLKANPRAINESEKKHLNSYLTALNTSESLKNVFSNYEKTLEAGALDATSVKPSSGANSEIMSSFGHTNNLSQGLEQSPELPVKPTYTPIETSSGFQNLTEKDVKAFIESPESKEFISTVSQISKKSENLVVSMERASESEVKLNTSIQKVTTFFRENKDVTDLFQKQIQEDIQKASKRLKEVETILGRNYSDKVIDEIVSDLISNAEFLEQNINTEMNPNDASIVPLLKKFRDIIEELDIKTRATIGKKLASKMIDDSFSKYIDENRRRLMDENESKTEILKIINSSSEVRDSRLPYKMKQMTLDDCAQKIALVALSYANK